jgi:hypothetical protein
MSDPQSLMAALANERERKCWPNEGIARKKKAIHERKAHLGKETVSHFCFYFLLLLYKNNKSCEYKCT